MTFRSPKENFAIGRRFVVVDLREKPMFVKGASTRAITSEEFRADSEHAYSRNYAYLEFGMFGKEPKANSTRPGTSFRAL